VYDGWNLLAIVNPQSSIIQSFMWGLDLSGSMQGAGGVGGLLEVSYHGSSTTNCFAAYDGNGNLTALINAADGTAVANYEYGAFGEPIRVSGVMANQNPIRWSTKYTDDESGLVYYGYRSYSPSLGRWLSRDPIEEEGGLNLYGFVLNAPTVRYDELGLTCDCGCMVCDANMIDTGKKKLLGRYGIAKTYLDPHRPSPMPEQNSGWACDGVAGWIGQFMAKTPPCWTCYVEERWGPPRWGWPRRIQHDLNVVVCESHPKSGPSDKIFFDYWHNAPPGQDYSVYLKEYPGPGKVGQNFPEVDCVCSSHAWTPNYYILDLLISDPKSHP
jgi:RHS repeat-associated protein